MSTALSRVFSYIEELLRDLKDRDYVLSDTRVCWASLYDHLLLTCGIAVALVVEVLGEKSPEDICGKNISARDLVDVVRVASLLHDWGKDYERAGLPEDKGYIKHTERSVEWARSFLEEKGVDSVYTNLILGAIERHHLDDGPKTLLERIICLADSLASVGDRPELAKAETWDEFMRVMHRTNQLYMTVFEGENRLVLILGDVDRVKSYVFETSKLPEIRGASELLKELNDEDLKRIFGELLSEECLIYSGGGSFLAVAPRRLADVIVKRVEEAYLSKTLIATITCVKSEPLGCFEFARGLKPYTNEDVRKLSGDGVGGWLLESHYGSGGELHERKGFGELVAQLAADLRLKKAERKLLPFYPALPIGMRCTSCGKRMVTGVVDDENRLCNVCFEKRKVGVKERKGFMDDFGSWLEAKVGIKGVSEKFPANLDELAEGFQGYMAFIYADGNDIGLLLGEARSPADYRRISETLRSGTREALYEALFETIGSEKLRTLKKLPFEIINVGGDDITLILAAPFAFDFAKNFLKGFEKKVERLSERFGMRITMSLGMVICKSKFPVYFAEKLAANLLSDAKRRAKETKNLNTESAFSYLYLTTQSGVEDSREIIGNTYCFKVGEKKWMLTMRPYTLGELEKLLEYVERIQRENLFSKTQLNALAEVLSKGRVRSVNYLLYQTSRLGERKMSAAQNLLEDIDRTFNCTNCWRTDDSGDVTPLLDLVEILNIRRKA
ncbi:MAG: Cas10/Cmr2 second palm domain-containing protein [Candidatus Freyarchaeota archaeon]